jgi:hypothetical protein
MMSIDAVTQAGAAFVEHDQTRERAEPGHEMAETGLFPMRVKIGDKTGNEDQIERAIAYDLIGDAGLAALGVTRFR